MIIQIQHFNDISTTFNYQVLHLTGKYMRLKLFLKVPIL